MKLSKTSQKTLDRLIAKSETYSGVRMPSIKSIHNLLNEVGIKHTYEGTQNVVEYRSAGNVYVNSRHLGKKGNEIRISRENNNANIHIHMDTSDSYYSWNTNMYAQQLVKIVKSNLNIQ